MPLPRVAVFWVNFGPYHLARLSALSDAVDVIPIQLAGRQQLYGWQADTLHRGETLFSGSYEEAPRSQLAGAVWRTLERIRPDSLLVPGYSEPPFWAAALWGRTHSAVNVLMSDSTRTDFPRKAWKETLKGAAVRSLFDRAIVSGRRAGDYLVSLGFEPSRIGLFYDVVDNDYFASGVASLRRSAEPSAFSLPRDYFLFVGRLVAVKNIAALIRAYAMYRSSGGTWSLVVVGRGPLETELKNLVVSLAMGPNVQFRGFRDNHQILPFYSFARCLVLPSLPETWGLVINEAMACGLPVIVSDRCGCVDDLVEPGGNGFTFDSASERELATCLQRMSSLPAAQREDMGSRSRNIVARYSLEAWTREVVRSVSGDAGDGRATAG